MTDNDYKKQTIEAAYLIGFEPSGEADEYDEALKYLTDLTK